MLCPVLTSSLLHLPDLSFCFWKMDNSAVAAVGILSPPLISCNWTPADRPVPPAHACLPAIHFRTFS